MGKMHAGKSTVSDVLATLGYDQARFASPVKFISAQMVNTMWSEVTRHTGARWNPQTIKDLNRDKDVFRGLFQFVGEYGRQAFGDSVWLDIFEDTYDGHSGPLVVDDVRYPNEAEYLMDTGFRVVLIKRPKKERRASVIASFEEKRGRPPKKRELKAIFGHPSETGVDDIEELGLYDDIFRNDGGVYDLEKMARGLTGRV